MWTSASTRRFVEIFAADNRPERVSSYKANFIDMVLPGDTLETKVIFFFPFQSLYLGNNDKSIS
mgnify:CR=1 FL=1